MRNVILFGLLLCMGVATAFGQKSTVQVFGVPFGSTYDEFLAAFNERGFTGDTYIYEGSGDIEVSSIYGSFNTEIFPEWNNAALLFPDLKRSTARRP